MSKFHGAIGWAVQTEIRPGVWEDVITERTYSGDILQKARRWAEDEKVTDNVYIENKVSVLADVYLYENFPHLRYVNYLGTRWEVSRVEINRPRIVITMGRVYNGPLPTP